MRTEHALRTALACLLAAVLAAPAFGGEVVDEIIMIHGAVPGQDGLSIPCRVKEIKDDKVWFIALSGGQKQGPVSIPLKRVRRIDYDVAGRRAELPAGDHLARYRLALWALERGLEEEALFDLESVAGKAGVPLDAYLLLAALQEKAEQYRAALASVKAYLEKGQDAKKLAEARAAEKRLAEIVKKLPPEPVDVAVQPDPEKPPNGGNEEPVKPPEPDKPKVDEGLETRNGWKSETWGNPATISLGEDEDTGNRYLAVQMPGTGRENKTAISLPVSGKLQSSKMVFNIYNPDKKSLPISLAFSTMVNDKWEYYEARTSHVGPGWKTVTVDLNGADFKCRATDWGYRSPIKGKDNLKAIIILVNTKRKSTIYLDYINFTD